jgi:N-acetylneuraminic acid mutarotase
VGVAALDGDVYVVGGLLEDRSTTAAVQVYDPDTDTWRGAASVPTPVHHTAVVAVAGKLYVVGGLTGGTFAETDATFEYDPAADVWIRKADMPTARGALGAAVVDGRIFAAGGSPALRERDFAAYDPVTDRWEVLPDLPTPRNHLAAGAIGGKFYAAGGRSGAIGGITAALEEFDPATARWTARAPLPTARGGIGGAVVGDRLVIFGGEGNPSTPTGTFEEVEAYDPATDSWTSLAPMPTPRHGIGAAVVAGLVYIPGGGAVQGFGVTNVNEAFDLGSDTPPVCVLDEACDDGDPCTAGDTCRTGGCVGAALSCFAAVTCQFEVRGPPQDGGCPRALRRAVRSRTRSAEKRIAKAERRIAGERVERGARLLRQARAKLKAAARRLRRAERRGASNACTEPALAALARRRIAIERLLADPCV